MSAARRAVRAEWTKLHTTPGAVWLLLVTALSTVALGAAVTAAAACPRTVCDIDPGRLALSGVYLGQVPIAVLAVLAVSGEYSTALIRTTVSAIPDRRMILAAKAWVLMFPTAAAGGVSVLACLLIGRHFVSLSVTDGATWRAGVGSVVYLIFVAFLGLGVAAILRDSAASIGMVLGLLYLPPILTSMVAEPHLQRLLGRAGPMQAGLAIQATTHLDRLPIGPWPGLGVLAAWSAAALLAGTLRLRFRDV